MDILKQVLGRVEEFHHISRMLRNYHEPKQHDWIDERAELLIADVKSAQQSVQRIGYWFAFLSFCAGVGAGWVMCLAYIANR